MTKDDWKRTREIESRFGHEENSIQEDEGKVVAVDSFHQQTGLKFIEEVRHLEHKFARC